MSALVELVGGLLLAVGFLTPLVTAVLVAQTVVIIGKVHLPHGFFNSKSGIEFPLVLGVGAAAIGLAGPGAVGFDAALGISVDPTVRALLLVAGILVGLATLAVPGLESRLASRTHAAAR